MYYFSFSKQSTAQFYTYTILFSSRIILVNRHQVNKLS